MPASWQEKVKEPGLANSQSDVKGPAVASSREPRAVKFQTECKESPRGRLLPEELLPEERLPAVT